MVLHTWNLRILGRIRQEGGEFKTSSPLYCKTLSQNPKKDTRRREREERKGRGEGLGVQGLLRKLLMGSVLGDRTALTGIDTMML